MSRRTLYGVGGVALAAGGYYLYTAGGNTKVAQKEVEHDMASAKTAMRGERLSGQEAKKAGEEWAARAGAKIDGTVNYARAELHEADRIIAAKAAEAENKFDKLKHEGASQLEHSKKEAKDSIDNFDKTVERKTAEAKSGLSSWFGFGGK